MEAITINTLESTFLFTFAFKVILLAFLLFYLIFSVLVIRQVQIMNHSIETSEAGNLSLLAKIHLAFASIVFVLILLFF